MEEQNERLLMDVNGEDRVKISEPHMAKCYDVTGKCCGCFCMITCCGCCCNPYKSVSQGFLGIITRFGTVKNIVTSGMQYVNPLSEKLIMVDVRTQVKKLSNQSVITKDNLPINIDGAIYYKIKNTETDVVKAVMGVHHVDQAVYDLAHATLRHVFGQHTLQEVLEKRNEFAQEIFKIIGGKAQQWGVIIEDIQIIDVLMGKRLQDLLATTAIAKREGEAEIVMARARVESAKLLREAADQLNSPAAMQMRTLETYKILGESANAKIIFMPGMSSVDPLTANIVSNETNILK